MFCAERNDMCGSLVIDDRKTSILFEFSELISSYRMQINLKTEATLYIMHSSVVIAK